MLLKNKKTGEIVEWEHGPAYKLGKEYESLKEFFDDWEDAPEVHRAVLPKRIRRMVQAWVDAQDNPIQKISILNTTSGRDQDGYYCYTFYGYIDTTGNKNLTAIDLEVRTKTAFEYDSHRDYLLEELGVEP